MLPVKLDPATVTALVDTHEQLPLERAGHHASRLLYTVARRRYCELRVLVGNAPELVIIEDAPELADHSTQLLPHQNSN